MIRGWKGKGRRGKEGMRWKNMAKDKAVIEERLDTGERGEEGGGGEWSRSVFKLILKFMSGVAERERE